MSPEVISVLPDTTILVAIDIMLANRFNGIPVVDKRGALVGILTKYDIIVKRDSVRDDTKVGDMMNKEPLFLMDSSTISDAIEAFSEHHKVDPIPVVSEDMRVIGIISRADMVRLFKEYGIPGAAPVASYKPKRKSSILPAVILTIIISFALLVYYFFF